MLLLIAITSCTTLAVVFYIVYSYSNNDKKLVKDRIGRYIERTGFETVINNNPSVAKADEWRVLIRRFGRYVEIPQWSRQIEHKLVQAGVPMRGAEFLVICLAVGFLGAVMLSVLSGGKLLLGLLGGILGYIAPIIILKLKIERRVRAFNSQLGDALILVANSLRTGYSFMQSIEMVSKEMPKPIGEEFARVLKEMSLGVTTEESLNNLAKRVNSEDLDLVITAVLIQRQVGGNLAEILDNISNTIRERVKIKGQIKTLTAQGRASGIVISLLPIAVGILISFVNPGYMGVLFTDPIGKAMIAAAVFSQLIGIVLIRKIVDIEV
ncbi:type II secretion system F family protein [Dendrosporobacter sp. 1207_IL3150]|uniref:type II secretion system F family protein n=1 Tax=Dendrosporobacter sp. 1207_IL3150 TaxID=3084054 RepID=UPI002FDB2737